MHNPLLSIVIANFNYGRFLEDAIRSVVSQRAFEDCELIVVDGDSTDNSVEIIKKYADKIAWWVSEPDKGQSDAFNKGFARARGKYLTWLNADDLMPDGALEKILQKMKRHPGCEWFTGNFFRFTEDGRVIEIGWGPHWYPTFLQRKNSPLVIFGPTSFFTKELYERAGRIREDMHFMMDNDLWYRFVMMGVKLRRINCFCWAFRMHTGSKTAEFGDHKLSSEQRAKFELERKACLERTGYRCSGVMRRLCLAFRLLDFSLIRKSYYQRVFRHYEI